ncbi:hypothetical protein DPEC_G00237740 [Dallia pectoralis]|uniref:Uncharacterized protein n=1 Tax=Dallia pectoralis TaxID=75939 RepID=A0ACC2FYI2_DALPE|nr:hypothetical protein DPEC_G00237740 [Dallia pectoralis]
MTARSVAVMGTGVWSPREMMKSRPGPSGKRRAGMRHYETASAGRNQNLLLQLNIRIKTGGAGSTSLLRGLCLQRIVRYVRISAGRILEQEISVGMSVEYVKDEYVSKSHNRKIRCLRAELPTNELDGRRQRQVSQLAGDRICFMLCVEIGQPEPLRRQPACASKNPRLHSDRRLVHRDDRDCHLAVTAIANKRAP